MSKLVLRSIVEGAAGQIIGLMQRVLQAPSLSGQEQQVADLIMAEMQALGYDEVSRDAVGNVVGLVRGQGGHTTLLHSHMDVVDPGDSAAWSRPPFAGEIADGYLWGRGASDDKGSLVAQVYALGLLHQAGLQPAGDVYVAAVVGEEMGGVGTRYLLHTLRPDVAIIGEPSGNTLRKGHRGRFEFTITWQGRSAHASAPHKGLNPHYAAARFLLALRDLPRATNPTFGDTTIVPTLSYVDQTSSNVIPSRLTLHLDWRNAPQETAEEAHALLQRAVDQTLEPGIQATIQLAKGTLNTYTGLAREFEHRIPSFATAEDDPYMARARQLLTDALARVVPVDIWRFATDGGHLAEAHIPCIGFGPGDEFMAHVIDERLAVGQLLEATAGYMALALGLGREQ